MRVGMDVGISKPSCPARTAPGEDAFIRRRATRVKGVLAVMPRVLPIFTIAVFVASAITLIGCGGSSSIKSSSTTPPPPSSACSGDSGDSGKEPPFDPGSFAPSPGPAGAFFGINTNVVTDPWPTTLIPMTNWRSLGGKVKWADINTGPGVYDFSRLDQWLGMAKANKTDVMYTVYATPTWASSHGAASVSPNSCCAFLSQNGPGICDPPSDLQCDGTGTDQMFIDFITALVQHVGPGTINYWELWNEPNVATEWNGDADCANSGVAHPAEVMLARMAKDLRTTVLQFDPSPKFTTPAATDGAKAGNWLANYLTNTDGGTYADINAFHGYINTGVCPSDCPLAEAVGDQIDNLTTQLPAADQNKPLFDTEGFWGDKKVNGVRTTAITDPDQQASFTARYYLIQMWKHVAKFYWYNWDIPTESTFYNATTHGISAAAEAYVQIVAWTKVGTASVGPCATNPADSTQWTCAITATGGTVSEAVWDTSQTCNSGTCTSVSVGLSSLGLPSTFNAYTDLTGKTATISGGTVPVGLKPILLTSQ